MKLKSLMVSAAAVVASIATLTAATPGTAPAAFGAPHSAPVQAGGHHKEKVILDTDMGQLNDDAIVMYMLANAPNVDLLGVVPVSGNSWVEEGTAYALRQLELIHRQDIPVVPGAGEPLMGSRQQRLEAEQNLWGNVEYMGAYSHPRPDSYLDLAEPPYKGYPKTKPSKQSGVDFIVQQVKKYPHQVTLFIIGPATDLALAVRTHPEIVPLVKQVIYMGGAIDIPGNTSPAAEFNFWFDPEAAKIALRTPFASQTVVPLDVAETVFYTKAEYDRIVSQGDTPIIQEFRDLHGPRFADNPDRQSFVWDSITAGLFLDPSIATRLEDRYVDIDDSYGPDYGRSIGYGPSRGRDLDDPSGFPIGTQRVHVLYRIDDERFWNLVIKLLTS